MKIVTNERPIPVDVDETLVMHHDPHSYDITVTIEDPLHPGEYITLGVNAPMVKILKDEKRRGAFITVWSRSGYAWALAVVTALNLEKYVDLVMTKPLVYMDDKDVSEWLKDRVYIGPKVTYKKHNTKPKEKNNGV
jgi:predicted phosphatase